VTKFLSQNEIDSLLDSFSTGDMEVEPDSPELAPSDEKIKLYDFKRPNRISKDQIRTLHLVHDSFARHLSNSLSSVLRSFIEVQVESIDQVTYNEVIVSMPSPTAVYIFRIEPFGRQGFLEVNLPLVFSIIDRVFGGKGAAKTCNRELTLIEESVMKKIANSAMNDLAAAWLPFYEMNIELETLQTNPRFLQISFQHDIVLYLSFKVIMEMSYGFINLCFPYLTLEPMIQNLTGQKWLRAATMADENAMKNHFAKELLETQLDIVAELGKSEIRIGELLNLEKGDVIRLDQNVDAPISLNVGGIDKMQGYPGLKKRSRAVKLTDVQLKLADFSKGDDHE